MPKRIVDGEAYWSSQKIRAGVQETFRPFYAYLLPLATANGTFECDPEMVHARCFAYLMPSVKPDDVRVILEEFARAGLLFRWRTEGKLWGYWTNIDKPGRLPGKSRHGTHERIGPTPPAEEVEAYKRGAREIHEVSETPLLTAGNPVEIIPTDEELESKQAPSSDAMELASALAVWIKENNPKAKVTEVQMRSWGREADLMMRRDHRSWSDIWQMIEWCQRDSFWKSNILSMGKLREKFDQLVLKRQNNGTRKAPGSETANEHLERMRRNAKTLGFGHS